MIDLSTLTIKSAREALKKGEFTARELVEASIESVKQQNTDLNAFLEVFDDVLIQADEADRQIKEGIDLPLLGVPIALKDNITVAEHRATAGSKILEGFISPTDSTAVKKLREAGAIIFGRTNCDEFAMGASTENSAFGPTKNPLDHARVPGGSSGGSAASVASNMVLGALGSDTGGSIRQPASFCGIVGFKPTYGRVSRSGLMAMASSFDQIGPFTKTVEDAEIIYEVLRGTDSMDSTTISDETFPKQKEFNKTLGVPRAFINQASIETKKNVDEAIEKFKNLGYTIVDVDLPTIAYSLAVYYILVPAEVSSNMARFDGVKYGLHESGANGIEDYFKTRGVGFGREVRRRIILGTYVLSSGYYDAYYGTAENVRMLIRKEIREAFKNVDLLILPTTPGPAFKFGERSSPLDMYLEDIFTVPANVSGCPCISLPFGTKDNLPLGIELIGDLGREDNLFKAGKEFLGE